MIDDFLFRAIIAGIGIALIAGLLGCFVVWRRMAYFGDSLSHSALLGIALGLTYNLNPNIGIILVCFSFALLLVWLQQKRIFATDTLLGIMAHSALSFGMVAISFLDNRNFDLHSYLFGDILTVTNTDIYTIYIGGFFIIGIILYFWKPLLLMTLHEDLAKSEGIKTTYMQLLLMLVMTVTVALSARIVGVLLITSLLIIPAASARSIASSPEKMAIGALLIGTSSICLGLYNSLIFDIPTGPSIICIASILFILIFILSTLLKSNF